MLSVQPKQLDGSDPNFLQRFVVIHEAHKHKRERGSSNCIYRGYKGEGVYIYFVLFAYFDVLGVDFITVL